MDLDLIVVCRDFDDVDIHDLKNHVSTTLRCIRKAMDKRYPGTRDTSFFERFGLRYNIAGMEIDILLAKQHVHPKDFLKIDDEMERKYLSASVNTMGRAYMKKQPYLFKDLVRVAKDWRDNIAGPRVRNQNHIS
mmetsp:Transcript_26157/g.39588  ORF Transcript_26157/g.39588 Transcript_26157/m.39588 type:complete len:134 (-) Transcript_26157:671-1072(-)